MAPNENGHGRIIKMALFDGHPQAAFYVVAAPDTAKAIGILRAAIDENYDEFEDVGRASKALLAALNLKRGDFRKLDRPTHSKSKPEPGLFRNSALGRRAELTQGLAPAQSTDVGSVDN